VPGQRRSELKRELLELLKEDEEFRYAVVGLLGLEDTRKALSKLARAIGRLATVHVRLERSVEELAKRVDALAAAHESLAKRVEELTAAHLQLEKRVEELAAAHARLERSVEELAKRVDALAAAHESLAKRVEELAAAQVRLERRVEELAANMSKLAEIVQSLAREVGRLSETIGFGLEDVARVVVPGWLYRHEGIDVEDLVRKFFTVEGEEVEVNLYGEGSRGGRKVYVLGEAKSRIYGDDVWRFYSAASKVAKLLKDGDVYMLMFGFYVHPTAEKAAEKLGVRLIASYMR
jgi:prefoldin subunit 5